MHDRVQQRYALHGDPAAEDLHTPHGSVGQAVAKLEADLLAAQALSGPPI